MIGGMITEYNPTYDFDGLQRSIMLDGVDGEVGDGRDEGAAPGDPPTGPGGGAGDVKGRRTRDGPVTNCDLPEIPSKCVELIRFKTEIALLVIVNGHCKV